MSKPLASTFLTVKNVEQLGFILYLKEIKTTI